MAQGAIALLRRFAADGLRRLATPMAQ